jgi:hypothetical protein
MYRHTDSISCYRFVNTKDRNSKLMWLIFTWCNIFLAHKITHNLQHATTKLPRTECTILFFIFQAPIRNVTAVQRTCYGRSLHLSSLARDKLVCRTIKVHTDMRIYLLEPTKFFGIGDWTSPRAMSISFHTLDNGKGDQKRGHLEHHTVTPITNRGFSTLNMLSSKFEYVLCPRCVKWTYKSDDETWYLSERFISERIRWISNRIKSKIKTDHRI